MSSFELEILDHARKPKGMDMGYIKHLPLDALENLGETTARTLPPCRPFEDQSDDVFQLDPRHFLDAVETVTDATPIGEVIDFGLIVEDNEQ